MVEAPYLARGLTRIFTSAFMTASNIFLIILSVICLTIFGLPAIIFIIVLFAVDMIAVFFSLEELNILSDPLNSLNQSCREVIGHVNWRGRPRLLSYNKSVDFFDDILFRYDKGLTTAEQTVDIINKVDLTKVYEDRGLDLDMKNYMSCITKAIPYYDKNKATLSISSEIKGLRKDFRSRQ